MFHIFSTCYFHTTKKYVTYCILQSMCYPRERHLVITYKTNFCPTASFATAVHPIFIFRSWSLFWQHSKASLLLNCVSEGQIRSCDFILIKYHRLMDKRGMFSWLNCPHWHKIDYWSWNNKCGRLDFGENYSLRTGSTDYTTKESTDVTR